MNPQLFAVGPVPDVNYHALAIALGHRIHRGLNAPELGSPMRRNRNVARTGKAPGKQQEQSGDGECGRCMVTHIVDPRVDWPQVSGVRIDQYAC